jgi:ketosteroid isomerase-like protein
MHSDRLRAAFESRDLERLLALMDPNVLWRGLERPDEETPICRSRAEVREVLDRFLERGGTGYPEILGEVGDSVVVDPRPDPPAPLSPTLNQVFTFRGQRIVLMQGYPDRTSALASVGL